MSRALKRPPQYLTKFCGLAVGAMSAFDEAQGAAAMRGDFPASMIQAIAFAFVREWCLCKSCGLPETDIEVTKKSVIFDCKACGARRRHGAQARVVHLQQPAERQGHRPRRAGQE